MIIDKKYINAKTLGSIANVFNAVGRLFWGYLVDRLPFKVNITVNPCKIAQVFGTKSAHESEEFIEI